MLLLVSGAWGAPALVGCSLHSGGHEAPVEPPKAFKGSGEAEVPDRWWKAFGDETLNRLEKRALAGNFDLKVARDRLREARAAVDRAAAADDLTLDLSVGAAHEKQSSNEAGGAERFDGALAAGYEVDLWKRIQAAIDRAKRQRDAARADLQAAAITLTANVASTWYELVQQRGQRALLQKQVKTNEQTLELIRDQFGQGKARLSDILRQERLLESTRETLAGVNAEIDVLEQQLMVLTGRSPTKPLDAEGQALPKLPPRPATGLPSKLIRRRPDVRAAFYRVKAADRAVAEAIADRFPRLTLSATASVSDEKATDIFDDWVRSVAANLTQPVLDAGRRKAEVRRTRSVKQRRIDAYAQSVLGAFREVTSALSREKYLQEQIRLTRHQVELAGRTVKRLQQEFLTGNISYIDLLDALTREQRLRRDLLEARFRLIDNRIGLYRALAGGWKGVVPPKSEES